MTEINVIAIHLCQVTWALWTTSRRNGTVHVAGWIAWGYQVCYKSACLHHDCITREVPRTISPSQLLEVYYIPPCLCPLAPALLSLTALRCFTYA